MKKIKIDQVMPSFVANDGVLTEAMNIKEIINRMGFQSDIYAHYIDPSVKDYARHSSEINADEERITILHYGIWDEIFEIIPKLKGKKILMYHNVTPKEFFRGFEIHHLRAIEAGKKKLTDIKDYIDVSICKSEFSAGDLRNTGYKNIEIIPYVVDFKKYDIPSPPVSIPLKNDNTRFLFVGRVVPNKCIEYLLLLYHYYKTSVESDAQLVIVGENKDILFIPYCLKLYRIIEYFDIKDVFFTGKVNLDVLVSYYRWANVFVTMSRHEGFCVPLLEAMYFNLPVFANNESAIPETMGDAGILINSRNYAEISELIDLCRRDTSLRNKIIEKQRRHLENFKFENIERKLKKVFEGLL